MKHYIPQRKEKVIAAILKSLVIAPILVIVLSISIGLFWRWDSSHNRGHHYGYWGEYNRIKEALSTIPDATVNQTYMNKDVTLEEFGFMITIDGKSINLLFEEDDPVRNLKKSELKQALLKMIKEKEGLTKK